jgi:glycosyltransferase involved in cell wall biosynthesis
MKKDPKVSIVLPTYNRAKTLQRSIQSVLSQSVTDFELIIVDDASQDNTVEIVHSFNDERVKYVKNDTNLGGAESRNVGIHHAKGELIAFQDSDDEWRPMKLERCLFELEQNKDLLGVYSAFWQIKGNFVRYMPLTDPPINGDIRKALLYGNFIDTPTAVVYRAALYECGGFDKEMPRYQDWELFLRLSSLGKFLFIKEPLILSYVTPNSISSDIVAHMKALSRIYYKNSSQIKTDKKLYAKWLGMLGDAQMKSGHPVDGRKKIIQSLINNPLDVRIAIKSLFALFGSSNLYKKSIRLCTKGKIF